MVNLSAVSEGRAVGGCGLSTVLINLAGAKLIREIRSAIKVMCLCEINFSWTCSKVVGWRLRYNLGWLGSAGQGLRLCRWWMPPSPSPGVSPASSSQGVRQCQAVCHLELVWGVNGQDKIATSYPLYVCSAGASTVWNWFKGLLPITHTLGMLRCWLIQDN